MRLACLLSCTLIACGNSPDDEPPPSSLPDAGSADAAPASGDIVAHVGGTEEIAFTSVTVIFSRADGTMIGAPKKLTAAGTVTLPDAPADTMVTALYDAALDQYVTVTAVQPGDVVELDYPLHQRLPNVIPGGKTGSLEITAPYVTGDYQIDGQIGRCWLGENNLPLGASGSTTWSYDLGAGCADDGALDGFFWVIDSAFQLRRVASTLALGGSGNAHVDLVWSTPAPATLEITHLPPSAPAVITWGFQRGGLKFQSKHHDTTSNAVGTATFDVHTAAPFSDGIHVTLDTDDEGEPVQKLRSGRVRLANDALALDADALLLPAVEPPTRAELPGPRIQLSWQNPAARAKADLSVVWISDTVEWYVLVPPEATSVTTPLLPDGFLVPEPYEMAYSAVDFAGVTGYAARLDAGAFLYLRTLAGATFVDDADLEVRFSVARVHAD